MLSGDGLTRSRQNWGELPASASTNIVRIISTGRRWHKSALKPQMQLIRNHRGTLHVWATDARQSSTVISATNTYRCTSLGSTANAATAPGLGASRQHGHVLLGYSRHSSSTVSTSLPPLCAASRSVAATGTSSAHNRSRLSAGGHMDSTNPPYTTHSAPRSRKAVKEHVSASVDRSSTNRISDTFQAIPDVTPTDSTQTPQQGYPITVQFPNRAQAPPSHTGSLHSADSDRISSQRVQTSSSMAVDLVPNIQNSNQQSKQRDNSTPQWPDFNAGGRSFETRRGAAFQSEPESDRAFNSYDASQGTSSSSSSRTMERSDRDSSWKSTSRQDTALSDTRAQSQLQRQPYVRPPSRTAVLTGLITSCSSLQGLIDLHNDCSDSWDHIHCCAALSRLAKVSDGNLNARSRSHHSHNAFPLGPNHSESASKDGNTSSCSSDDGSSSSSSSSSTRHPGSDSGSVPAKPSKQEFMLTLLQQVLQPRLRVRLRGREIANVMWAMAKVGWDPSVTLRSQSVSCSNNASSGGRNVSSSGAGSSSTGLRSQTGEDTWVTHGLHDESSCFEQLLHMACDDSRSGALWKLNPQELSNILYALATAPPSMHTSRLVSSSHHAEISLSAPGHSINGHNSHDSADLFETPTQQRSDQVHALASALQASFPDCGPQALSNAIWALSRLYYYPSQQWMHDFLRCSEPQLYDFTDQGLSITVVAMARLHFRPPPAWRYALLDSVWRLLPRARTGQAAANTLWAMVAMGQVVPDDWVDACLASLATRSSSLSEEDLSNALVAAAKTRRRPPPEALDGMLGRAYDLMPSCSLKAVATIVSALAVLQLRPTGGWMNRLLNCVYKAAVQISSNVAVSSNTASKSGSSLVDSLAGSQSDLARSSAVDWSRSSLPIKPANSQGASAGLSVQIDVGRQTDLSIKSDRLGTYPVRILPVADVSCHAFAAVLKALAALEFKPTKRWLEGVLLILQCRAETGLLLRVDAEQSVAACEVWGHDPGEALLRAAHLLL